MQRSLVTVNVWKKNSSRYTIKLIYPAVFLKSFLQAMLSIIVRRTGLELLSCVHFRINLPKQLPNKTTFVSERERGRETEK